MVPALEHSAQQAERWKVLQVVEKLWLSQETGTVHTVPHTGLVQPSFGEMEDDLSDLLHFCLQ